MGTFVKSTGEMFGALFPIVSPTSAIPVFLALTARSGSSERMKVAFKSAVIVFAILVLFLFAGEPVLYHFGISLEGLQIAGGIIVAVTGLRMVLEQAAVTEAPIDRREIAFSPLAMPLLAGPGALGVLMGLEARRTSNAPLAGFVVGILLIALTIFVFFALGGQLIRFIGEAGVDAINRIFGLLVMAIGVEMVVHGINEHEAFKSALGLG